MLPTSRPRVGWSRTSRRRSPSNSRATTIFCWLPPDSVPARTVRRRRPDVVLRDRLRPALGDRVVVAEDPAGVRRVVVVGQDEVVGDREREDEPEPVAVGRDVAGAEVGHLARAEVRDVLAVERDRALATACAGRRSPRRARPGRCRRRRRCRRSRRPGSRSRPRGRPRCRGRRGPSGRSTVEADVGRVGLAAVDDELDVAADHQRGEVLLVGLRRAGAGRRPCRGG